MYLQYKKKPAKGKNIWPRWEAQPLLSFESKLMGHSCLSDQLHDRKHDSCNCSAIGERFAEISFDKTKYRHSGFTKICNYFLRLPVPVFLVHSLSCNVYIFCFPRWRKKNWATENMYFPFRSMFSCKLTLHAHLSLILSKMQFWPSFHI